MDNTSEIFLFSTQQPPTNSMTSDSSKILESSVSAKRARAESDVLGRNEVAGDNSKKEPNVETNFMPGEDVIHSLPIWVRLSKLPMEWMDSDLLWSIGGMLGKMCKVDPITVNQTRGRFARICVETGISKPFIGALFIEDINIRVEYQSLGLVCFKCGRYS
ncbi:hypothetical protein Dsin_009305 [Dipteronia sinensis]|uniref:DUF4283 domain-containing protein n=1 Tax=Dipteronia sinensis TaxID=43782 RepID=A0AAE0EDD3_9ROSI|nr:hypothetical protein Dsin_009305 [Dipteronia sinensis]